MWTARCALRENEGKQNNMRERLKELVLQNWSGIDEGPDGELYGYGPHVDVILAMKPGPQEREELACLLLEVEGDEVIATLTGVMETEPDPVYRGALLESLDSLDAYKKCAAMRALLRGNYDGAWECLFSRPDVQVAMGDEFPWEIWRSAKDLPEAWQRRYLEVFCERFEDDPPLHMMTRQWLRTLAEIPVTDERTAATLVRTWQRLSPRDSMDRYLVLLAMAASPAPAYEPMFPKVRKSPVLEMRQAAREGLKQRPGR